MLTPEVRNRESGREGREREQREKWAGTVFREQTFQLCHWLDNTIWSNNFVAITDRFFFFPLSFFILAASSSKDKLKCNITKRNLLKSWRWDKERDTLYPAQKVRHCLRSLNVWKPHLCGKVWIDFLWLCKKCCSLNQIFFSSSDIYYLVWHYFKYSEGKMNVGSNSQSALGGMERHYDFFLDHFSVDFLFFLLNRPLVIELTLLPVEWFILSFIFRKWPTIKFSSVWWLKYGKAAGKDAWDMEKPHWKVRCGTT